MANPRITEDYSSHTKDELLAEIDARRTEGRTIDGSSSTLKDDLVAALDLDDHAKAKPAPTPKAADTANAAPMGSAPLIEASNIPTITTATPTNIPVAEDRPALTEYGGTWISNVDGEPYALAIKEDAPDNKTHFLINSVHFDNCTKEEFRQRYDEKRK